MCNRSSDQDWENCYVLAHLIIASGTNVAKSDALEAGARAYVLRSMPPKNLVGVIRRVHAGKKPILPETAAHLAEHYSNDALSDREVEVLRQIAEGNRNQDIAEKLFIREETVKVYIKHIMEKLNASDRTQAVAIAVRRGFINL